MVHSLISFIKNSPSAFHSVANMSDFLLSKGFILLSETEPFHCQPGKNYFLVRNQSALCAFKIPQNRPSGFSIISAHTDSPCFKIKENPEITDHYTTLNVEKYGGMLASTWFDRPLSIAGRIIYKSTTGPLSRLVNFDRDLVSIVNLAIHQNKMANQGQPLKTQKEMLPLLGLQNPKLTHLLSDQCTIKEDAILSYDLFLYNRMVGSIWGAHHEFFSAPKIDDLQCAFTALKSLVKTENAQRINLCTFFDNEEVGSSSRQGALSDFLENTLHRIALSLAWNQEDYYTTLAHSFMLSADNGHALHPNYPEVSNPQNHPILNHGLLIKYAANQKYSTDAWSAAVFKMILDEASIPYQAFMNHSDYPGGSTLGNLSNQHISIPTVDMGTAQLAMHSAYETAGVKDATLLYRGMCAFFEHPSFPTL